MPHINRPPAFMSPGEIAAFEPKWERMERRQALARARSRMIATDQWNTAQCMGRRWAIGCVALEITQRCNLDCRLCYLSESAEAVHDIPVAEIYRRIDAIRDAYGQDTDVQITGGDPTLRRRDELVAIVRRVRDRGMRPTLFTNGIRAGRDLLLELAGAGLVDVAFHVDMTQERRGYASEAELNEVRREYIERARGINLAVIFNTTVFSGNAHEVPDLAAFFVRHSDVVTFASFQLQADTGRGRERGRPGTVSAETISSAIALGVGCDLSFGFPGAGHSKCNRYAMALVCNGRAFNFYDDRRAADRLIEATADISIDRTSARSVVWTLAKWAVRHPFGCRPAIGWLFRKAWKMRRDLIAARGRVRKVSFFVDDFMHACHLDRERIDACVFMVASADGPVPMCLHNARRDDFLLRPVRRGDGLSPRYWNPATGALQHHPGRSQKPLVPPRRRKGLGAAARPRSIPLMIHGHENQV